MTKIQLQIFQILHEIIKCLQCNKLYVHILLSKETAPQNTKNN